MASRAQLDLIVSLRDEATSGLTRIGGAIGGLATGALTGLTVGAGAAAAALTGIGIAGVAAASSLEQEMANTAAIMGLTADETAELKDLVNDLGLDPKLKVSATEAAQAIQELGAQGLSVEQIMSGAARATVLLSNATGGDMVQSATVATDAMALWNMEAAEMERAVDSITSVANVSKFGIED
jgi:TP901 family phage tail tape measure protein